MAEAPHSGSAFCPQCGPLRQITARTARDLSYWIAKAYDRHRREHAARRGRKAAA